MSSGLIKMLLTNYSFTNSHSLSLSPSLSFSLSLSLSLSIYIYIYIYMYKQDLVSNSRQGLIRRKIHPTNQPNSIKYYWLANSKAMKFTNKKKKKRKNSQHFFRTWLQCTGCPCELDLQYAACKTAPPKKIGVLGITLNCISLSLTFVEWRVPLHCHYSHVHVSLSDCNHCSFPWVGQICLNIIHTQHSRVQKKKDTLHKNVDWPFGWAGVTPSLHPL